MSYIVRRNQNLIDIAIQCYGSQWIRGMLQIIQDNDVSLAEGLTVGTTLEINNVDENDLSLKYIREHDVVVATGQYSLPKPQAPTNLTITIR